MAKTFTVRGVKVRTSSQRRYVVVAARAADSVVSRWDYRVEGYVDEAVKAFTEIVRRSDSIDAARAAVRKYGRVSGGFVVIVDTVTGEEV